MHFYVVQSVAGIGENVARPFLRYLYPLTLNSFNGNVLFVCMCVCVLSTEIMRYVHARGC